MKPVQSTIEILAFKALNRDITRVWIDWAVEMLMVGYDTENLAILAGESEPYNQFELHDLTTRILNELELDYSDKERSVKNYVVYLVDKTLNSEMETMKCLGILKDLCVELNYEKYLYHFYTLYFAKDSLLDSVNQWYLEGADRGNIDKIIAGYFVEWRNTHLQNGKPDS